MTRVPVRVASAVVIALCAQSSAFGAAPRLRIEAPSSGISGALVRATAVLDAQGAEVLGWSLSVFVEGLAVLEATTSGTDFERLSRGGFAETLWRADAFATVGVLSFSDTAILPPGNSSLLAATCRVSRKDPGSARFIPRGGYEPPEGGSPIDNQALLAGGAIVALSTLETAMPVRGCAAFALALGANPPGEIPPLELPPRGTFELAVWVRVASPEHLAPTGFSLGLRHDPAELAIAAVEWLPEFARGFLRADGWAKMEIEEGGFSVSVVSSQSAPAALGPGDHRALRAIYRLAPTVRPRHSFVARLEFAQGDGSSPATFFQPEHALPCDLSPVEMAISVKPDDWIRGEVNGDGRLDISDAIGILGDLFLGMEASCQRAMDTNDDRQTDLADAVYLLNHLFAGGAPPPSPYPDCGWADSDLSCLVSACQR